MSQEHVERYRRVTDAWNRGDLEAWLEETADEVRTTGSLPGIEPVYRGREGMRALWDFIREPWENGDVQISIERIEDLGSTVLALLIYRAKGTGSGVEVMLKVAHVATEEEDGFSHVTTYLDWDEALDAVGLLSRSGRAA
jgi:hypothetical protein